MSSYVAGSVVAVLLLAARLGAQPGVRETTPSSAREATAPLAMQLSVDADGSVTLKMVTLKRACSADDDVDCVPPLVVLLEPEGGDFTGDPPHADLLLVHSATRRPVAMLHPPATPYHWRVTLRPTRRKYIIDWGRGHPPLKTLENRRFRIAVVGADEIESPPFTFRAP